MFMSNPMSWPIILVDDNEEYGYMLPTSLHKAQAFMFRAVMQSQAPSRQPLF